MSDFSQCGLALWPLLYGLAEKIDAGGRDCADSAGRNLRNDRSLAGMAGECAA
ncbi:MAG: hypothetical protein MJZ42_05765 [Bacteroidales bacterium]|nr:hypothetical protein [Bacteroidales bacterium]